MTWRREFFGGLITAEVRHWGEEWVFFIHNKENWQAGPWYTEEEAVSACLSFLQEKGVPMSINDNLQLMDYSLKVKRPKVAAEITEVS